MSTYITGLVWKTELGGPTVKAVAMKLADHAHDDGTKVYPSVRTVARQAEVSPRSAQYAIRKLVSIGLLHLVKQGGGRNASEYRFNMARLMELHNATKAKWDAEDAKPKRQVRRTPAKSAPVQEVHPSTAPVAPQGRTSCTLTINEPSFNHQADELIKKSIGCKSASIDRQLLQRAEGFGLPVDEIVQRVAAEKPRNASAYFQSIAKRKLREKVPGLNDAVIGRAFSGDTGAIGTIQNILMLAEAA